MEIQLFVVCQRHSYFSKYTQKTNSFLDIKTLVIERFTNINLVQLLQNHSTHASPFHWNFRTVPVNSDIGYWKTQLCFFFFFTSCIGIFIIFNFVLFLAHCPNCNCIPQAHKPSLCLSFRYSPFLSFLTFWLVYPLLLKIFLSYICTVSIIIFFTKQS